MSATTSHSRERLMLCLSSLHDLAKVENLIRQKFASHAPRLREICAYLFDLGGKRIRPAICLMTAKALQFDTSSSQDLVDVAAGIELIHMATLLHDDIIDNAQLRRHSQSPYLKFGLGDTLLSGDFLLVRAFSLCAHLDQYIIDATERACVELTEGEILETPLAKVTHSIDSALDIARRKTASLFRLACESAAFLARPGDTVITHFSAFGESLGMAFQALDDILDVTASEDLLGKASGTDIREKKPSLVNVLWLKSGDPVAARMLLGEESVQDQQIADAVQFLRGSDVIIEARKIARSFAVEAESRLDEISRLVEVDLPSFQGLKDLVSYCIERME
ncbi:MAG: polyprenyl synthetase family protein [Deltaproteobacteria bacterium]|nr:polyprenyl synthetase family protein [Deltaproteobacteria bacterium]